MNIVGEAPLINERLSENFVRERLLRLIRRAGQALLLSEGPNQTRPPNVNLKFPSFRECLGMKPVNQCLALDKSHEPCVKNSIQPLRRKCASESLMPMSWGTPFVCMNRATRDHRQQRLQDFLWKAIVAVRLVSIGRHLITKHINFSRVIIQNYFSGFFSVVFTCRVSFFFLSTL